MLTRDDLIDLIVSRLRALEAAPPPAASAAPAYKENAEAKGRLFLSEYDIKKRLTPGGRRLTIPKDAILSPLAVDWLILQGIEVVRE